MRRVLRLLAPALLAAPAAAQAPAAERRAADSLAVAGDTAGALAGYARLIAADPRDAGAWHRQGVLLWQQVQPHRRGGFMRDVAQVRRLQLADSSLRRAALLAPDSARYLVDLGRFITGSDLGTLRTQAPALLDRALAAARRGGDPFTVAEAADEAGMVHWRRYETMAERRPVRGASDEVTEQQLDRYARDPDAARTFVESFTADPGDAWPGRAEHERALALFEEAVRADPAHGRAGRHRFMALAERGRWDELGAAAAGRLAAAPWDALAWQARGLAMHRLGRAAEAAAAFDSALAAHAPAERERLTRLSRVLRPSASARGAPSDSARWAAGTPAARERLEGMYWLLADPLTLTPANEHRLEFLSRVTFAELRWTSDDFALRGADTDRGDVHVRYGPPRFAVSFPPVAGVSTLFWVYDDGLAFAFRTPPGLGVASFAGDYRGRAENLRTQLPVRWTNVPVTSALDSIPVQVARFRGAGDSTELAVAARVPVHEVAAGAAALALAFTLHGDDASLLSRDSIAVPVRGDSGDFVRLWRRRLAAGTAVYRVEAYEAATGRAGRGMGVVEAVAGRGFGVSDLLLAGRAEAPATGARRWHEVDVVPSAGMYAPGERVALVWETYALSETEGTSRYRVQVTVRRRTAGGATGLALRVLGGAQGAVGRGARGRDRATVTYERQAAAAPVVVDVLALGLDGAPPGQYAVEVQVTDVATGAVATREATFSIGRRGR